MKRNILLNTSFFLLLAFGLFLPSCSEEFPGNDPVSAGQTIRICVDDSGYSPAPPQTRASEENLKTVFTAGDKIGVFAVQDGEIKVDVKNICLTASTDNGSLVWQSDDGLSMYPDATYYAYYPWQDNLTGKLVPTAGNANSFFANVITAWSPADDQSDYTNYTAQDLMIAQGSLSNKKLTFSMAHQMSLVVIELPKANLKLSNDESYTWISDIPDMRFEFNPCRMSDGTYRYLVKPSASDGLSGSYINGSNAEVTWTVTPSVSGGKYKTYKVDGGSSTIIDKPYTLQAGDFFMKDGSLVGKDVSLTADQKAACIGIVFWVGDPTKDKHTTAVTGTNDRWGTTLSAFGDPALKSEYPECTHGLVVALKDAGRVRWQETPASVSNWMTNSIGYEKIVSSADPTAPVNKIRGYNNTKAIEAYNAECSEFNKVLPISCIATYATEVPAPGSSSGWYFPSAKELSLLWQDINSIYYNDPGKINKQEDVEIMVNSSLNKLGAPFTTAFNGIYWSSTEYSSNGYMWYTDFSEGKVRNMTGNYAYGVRPILAF